MKRNARGLALAFPAADTIISSPLPRCIQTAEWVSRAYGGRIGLRAHDALRPESGTDEVRILLSELIVSRVILVGHEPNLTEILRELVKISGHPSTELKKGGAYGIRITEDGAATLDWLLPPRLLRSLR